MEKEKLRLIFKCLIGASALGILVCTIGIISTTKQYSDSKKTYADLNKMVTIDSSSAGTQAPVTKEAIPSDEGTAEEPVEEKIDIPVSIDVDFAALKEINSDVIGWLVYEPVELSYPVVKDKGDDYYEHYSFDLEKNIAGAIFLDYICKPDLSGFNSIIYGHNMRNGTMFGSLKKVLADTSMIEQDPYFYIFTEDYTYMYKIVCAYYTTQDSRTYELTLDDELDDLKSYIEYMEEVGTYKDEEFFKEPVTEDTKLATLSTCHGLHSKERTVIHGVLVTKQER